MGHRVLDSLPRPTWVCLDHISCRLCPPAVRQPFVCAWHLWADDWVLRDQPNCWIPSRGANLRYDGISRRCPLPVSCFVGRCDWETRVRLVVDLQGNVAVTSYERLQRISFN